jgi:hypothetical protein
MTEFDGLFMQEVKERKGGNKNTINFIRFVLN